MWHRGTQWVILGCQDTVADLGKPPPPLFWVKKEEGRTYRREKCQQVSQPLPPPFPPLSSRFASATEIAHLARLGDQSQASVWFILTHCGASHIARHVSIVHSRICQTSTVATYSSLVN